MVPINSYNMQCPELKWNKHSIYSLNYYFLIDLVSKILQIPKIGCFFYNNVGLN